MDEGTQPSVFHSLSNNKSGSGILLFVLALGVVVVGVVVGHLLATMPTAGGQTANQQAVVATKDNIKVGTIYGSNDTTTFKDTAEGVDTAGGIDNEGQYHLVRPGGDSQNVYMTSSVVDLSLFLNRKIKVWGQTQKAQSAGWLMDVGRVEVLQ